MIQTWITPLVKACKNVSGLSNMIVARPASAQLNCSLSATAIHASRSAQQTAQRFSSPTANPRAMVLEEQAKPAPKQHPLDPLSAAEISAAAEACEQLAQQQGIAELRFNVITLQEPPKAALVAYEAGSGPCPPRQAFAILQDPSVPAVYEVALQLLPEGPTAKVLDCNKVEGVQPLATPDDCFDAEAIAKADPQVVALLAERGLTDLQLVACDPWSVHASPEAGRVIQLFMYARSSPNDNAYAHPLDLLPLVDLNLRKVIRIDQHSSPPKVPSQDSNYHSELFAGQWRADIKPLDVLQPEVGFNYREGLVLHQLGYEDGGRVRPVMHRASLVEMAVPYGDPREPFQRKCAFDVGDYGLGYCCMPLTLGCDCLGHIHYFDATLINSKGQPVQIKNAVCMHEEDVGLLWKHVEYRNGHSESRRSRRLVISFIATVVNYEYAMYWYLYQDGSIGYEIKLTGELSTNAISEGEEPLAPTHGTLVLPGVNAQHHQHMFCMRLDLAVDDAAGGQGLVVSEVDAVPMPPGPDNPHLNGFTAVETDLTSTSAAQRLTAPDKGRIWKVKNPAVLNPITHKPVAYKLMPMATPRLLARPESVVGKRAVFASKNLWVTPYAEEQRFPAGNYLMGSTECNGLRLWTQEDQSLEGVDPVLWYSFGVTHIVRPEDFPVMPVETTGFMLKPFGFFSLNPGLDVPPGKNEASRLASAVNGSSSMAGGAPCTPRSTNGCCGGQA